MFLDFVEAVESADVVIGSRYLRKDSLRGLELAAKTADSHRAHPHARLSGDPL